MSDKISKIRLQFAELIGEKHVLKSQSDMARFMDEPRKKFFGTPAGVLRPASTQEVSAILALANETGTAIVPQGGNTGLVGGQIPDGSGEQFILSLERLNKIRSVDASQDRLVIEAGATLMQAQEAAANVGRFFPLSLASEGTCTIGGNLATNAGGVNVVAYGNMRQLCVGLEVVMADGRVWDSLQGLAKDNTGYDLKNLFIGSEGTLGIITAATLKLFPAIAARATAFIGISQPEDALALLDTAQTKSGQRVTSIELLPRLGLELTIKHKQARDPFDTPHPWYVLLEFSSCARGNGLSKAMEQVLSLGLEKGFVEDAVIAQSDQQAADLWAIRELLPESQKPEGGSIKHDICVPLSKIPEFLRRAEEAVKDIIPDARPVPFGHVGDGNIHFNITQPANADKAAFLDRWEEVNTAVHAIVMELDGSISAEHGIGQLKRHLMPDIKSALELEMMGNIKRQFDPNGILNPGKVLP